MNIHLTWPDSADVDAGANSVNHASRWLLLIKAAKVITTDKEPPRKKNPRPSCRKTLGSEMEFVRIPKMQSALNLWWKQNWSSPLEIWMK